MNNLKYRINILRMLFPYTKGHRKSFTLLSICNFIGMMAILVSPIFYKILIDDVIISKNLSSLLIVILGYVAIYIVTLLLDILKTHSTNIIVNNTLLRVRKTIFNNYLEMSFEEYGKHTVGDLKMRVDEDTDKLNIFAQAQTSQWVISLLTCCVTLVILFKMSIPLALFSMIIVPITFYLGHIVSKVEGKLLEERRKLNAANESWLYSNFIGWKEVKALNLQRHQFRKYLSNLHKIALNNSKWIMLWTLRVLVIPLFKDEFLMKFSLYFFGGFLVMSGHFSIGALLVFMRYYGIFYNDINQINNSDIELRENKPSFDRVIDMLNKPKNEATRYKDIQHLKGNIELKNVSFGYTGTSQSSQILQDIKLQIRKGEKVAIVGKSGAGKTTLLKLLLGVLESPKDTIFFDGVDKNQIPPQILYKNIGVVMQDSILFNMSIRDNLKLINPDCTDEELDVACEKAGIKDFIDTLPKRYDTLIGEKGVKLSGGQRQRLTIARVFLRNPNIVIFDEATSALDGTSENIIHNSIRQLGGDKSAIIVAHRLSSVLVCDKVAVLKDGKIVAFGTHHQLLQHSHDYNELFREQYLTA